MDHLYGLGLVTWRYQVRIPVGPDICHPGCANTVLKTVQRHGVYSAVDGTVCTAKLKSPAVWACLEVYPLDMPRTPYRASEGKRSQ